MGWDKLDDEGYPTPEFLDDIRTFAVKNLDDAQQLLRNIQDGGWHYPDWFAPVGTLEHEERVWLVSTGGWSGNEEVIEHMQRNTMFWTLAWMGTRRGGHYMFSTIRR